MARALAKAGRREIGGVLMAEQLEPGTFRIVDFSIDSVTGTAAHFVRSVEHHKKTLTEFYERTGADYSRFNYLGEWHSHPNHVPLPSSVDVASMEQLIYGERDIPFAMLLIVQKRWWRGMICSATLFQQNGTPEPIEISPD
jgi:integrative and conjugative element protein (TIGR02256 family)